MKLRTPAYIFVPLTLMGVTLAFMMVLPNDEVVSKTGFAGWMEGLANGLTNVFSSGFYWAVILIALVMLLIINSINKMVENGKFKKLSPEEQQAYLAKKKEGYLKTLWRSSGERQTEEEEQSIILDHGFDGITELDNSLPQWWLSFFYFGCAFMVIYMLAFSFTDFAHPVAEYEEESEFLDKKFATWIKNNDITIDGAINKYQDEAIVDQGKVIFENICATCHKADGGGAAGPNLTDDYWINQLQDSLFYNIYNVVYDGSPNNPAMVAFGQTGQLTGLDIEAVASYVYKMNMETTVTPEQDGLAPQGEIAPWYGNIAAPTNTEAAEGETGETAEGEQPKETSEKKENNGEVANSEEVEQTTEEGHE